MPNYFAMAAFHAAYDKGEPWLEAVLDYIKGNLDYLTAYLEQHIPQMKVVKPEGTYLAWIDCTELNLCGQSLGDFFANEANIYISDGAGFGAQWSQFIRLNLACPRATLEETARRIEQAVKGLK